MDNYINPTQLVKMLRETTSFIEINFFKKDGTKRKMRATLNFDKIPIKKRPKEKDDLEELTKKTDILNEMSFIRVFDTEKGEWRGFIFKSIFEIKSHGKIYFIKYKEGRNP